MKTDSIFYELFLNLPQTLFQMLNQPAELAENYRFLSQELKQLAKRIDGVFIPNSDNQPIYFVEVQFQEDNNLYHRLFTEIFTYLGQYQPSQDWCAVVFWQKRSLDLELPPCYQDFRRWGKLTIFYLDELDLSVKKGIGTEIIKLIVVTQEEAKQQVENLFELIESEIESLTKKKDIIELVEKILTYKFDNYTREELDKMFTLTDFKKTRFYQDTFKEGEMEVKLKSIPKMFKLGISKEEIANILEVDLDFVNQVIQQQSSH